VADYEYPISGPGDWDRFKHRLDNLETALQFIGGQTIAQARNAFTAQKLGDVSWPARSPAQKEPFINIIPVVRRAGMGQAPTADDFRRRPALFSSPWTLKDGITFLAMGRESVEIGHPAPWSGQFQWGTPGVVKITETTRETLAKWLAKQGGKRGKGDVKFRKKDGDGNTVTTNVGPAAAFAKKLAFVWTKDQIYGRPYKRPFLGMTPELYAEIDESIARHVGARIPGSSAPLPPLPGASAT
jgi:hypothetical protein